MSIESLKKLITVQIALNQNTSLSQGYSKTEHHYSKYLNSLPLENKALHRYVFTLPLDAAPSKTICICKGIFKSEKPLSHEVFTKIVERHPLG